MLLKYGFTNTFYNQIIPTTDDYLTPFRWDRYKPSNFDKIEKSLSFNANHGFSHYTHIHTYPNADGRNYPSNDDMRADRGDGTNEFNHPLTETVEDSLGTSYVTSWLKVGAAVYTKQWQNLSDANCDTIRQYMSAFTIPLDPQNGQQVLEALDYLSNRYCGTTGTSVYGGDYTAPRTPNTADGQPVTGENPIVGGVFQGAYTTRNYEIWRRIAIIIKEYKEEVLGIKKTLKYWTSCGGGHPGLLYHPTGAETYKRYYDTAHNNLATGSIGFYDTSIEPSGDVVINPAFTDAEWTTNGVTVVNANTISSVTAPGAHGLVNELVDELSTDKMYMIWVQGITTTDVFRIRNTNVWTGHYLENITGTFDRKTLMYGYGNKLYIEHHSNGGTTTFTKFEIKELDTFNLLDILRDSGYIGTFSAFSNGFRVAQWSDVDKRREAQRIYKLNGSLSKIDNIGDGFAKSFRVFDNTIPEADINTLLGSSNVLQALYDYTSTEAVYVGGNHTTGKFDSVVNEVVKRTAWGIIPDFIGDSGSNSGAKDASFALVLESFFQFCRKAGIRTISHESALDISYDKTFHKGLNMWPNPTMKNTVKDVLPDSVNTPDEPDGWSGGVIVSESVEGETKDCLHIENTGGGGSITKFTRWYGIQHGTLDLSVWGKGIATLKIKTIKNDDLYNDSNGDSFTDFITININNASWSELTGSGTIADAPLVTYGAPSDADEKIDQLYFRGYDDKVCGLHIELVVAAGDEIKITNPFMIIT